MKAGDWLHQREVEARREGSVYGALVGVFVGLALMTGVHMALNIHADKTHAAVVASIKQADAILMRECEAIVVDLGEPVSGTYEEVRDYKRSIVALQGGAK